MRSGEIDQVHLSDEVHLSDNVNLSLTNSVQDESEPNLVLAESEAQNVYKSLPLGYIRLLVLHPSQGDESVSCKLVTVQLNSAPPYEAISYAWGKEINLVEMNLNGKQCRTSHNVVECLHDIRFPETDRVVWVDSLCTQNLGSMYQCVD